MLKAWSLWSRVWVSPQAKLLVGFKQGVTRCNLYFDTYVYIHVIDLSLFTRMVHKIKSLILNIQVLMPRSPHPPRLEKSLLPPRISSPNIFCKYLSVNRSLQAYLCCHLLKSMNLAVSFYYPLSVDSCLQGSLTAVTSRGSVSSLNRDGLGS